MRPTCRRRNKARDDGFRTTAHAGEAAGADSVWSALRNLQVDRIGHGTRAREDDRLVDHLAEHKIPVEACPQSNVRTAVVPRLSDHPLKDYLERGLVVSVNTDDPKMFQTSMEDELACLADTWDFGMAEFRTLLHNAIDSAWCDEDKKAALRAELDEARAGQ